MSKGFITVYFSFILALQILDHIAWHEGIFKTHSALLSSKSIVSLDSFHIESIFRTWRMSDFALVISWSMTFAGIFIFSVMNLSIQVHVVKELLVTCTL